MSTKLIDSQYLNGSPLVLLILGVILLIFSIILICGKGSFLIAGYNTASKEEKERYDEKKLCRVMGFGMLIISLMLVAMFAFVNVLPEVFVWIFGAAVLIDVIVMIILVTKCCIKK